MEGGGVDSAVAQQFPQAVAHFRRGVDGVGEGQNLAGFGMALANQALNAMGQDRSLARAGPSHHEQRSVDMLDGLTLTIVGSKGCGAGDRLQTGITGQNITWGARKLPCRVPLGTVGETPTGQPPGRRRYFRGVSKF